MRVIEKIAVVVSSSSKQFHDTLMGHIQRFQEEGLEVVINSPHFVREVECSFKHYGAVVEGHKTVADCRFPEFNTVPNRRI